MTLDDYRDETTPVPKSEKTPTANEDLTEIERQLIEKVRSMRRDRRKVLYMIFGIRTETDNGIRTTPSNIIKTGQNNSKSDKK